MIIDNELGKSEADLAGIRKLDEKVRVYQELKYLLAWKKSLEEFNKKQADAVSAMLEDTSLLSLVTSYINSAVIIKNSEPDDLLPLMTLNHGHREAA